MENLIKVQEGNVLENSGNQRASPCKRKFLYINPYFDREGLSQLIDIMTSLNNNYIKKVNDGKADGR